MVLSWQKPTQGGIFWAEKWFIKLVGGTVFQAEGTACAKTLRHPELLWGTVRSPVWLKTHGQGGMVEKRLGRSSKNMVGAGIYLSMISHWRIVSREVRWSHLYIRKITLAVVVARRPSPAVRFPTNTYNITEGPCLRALCLHVQIFDAWMNNWMNMSVKGSGCPCSSCPRQRILCYPILITVLLIQSIWTCYKPAGMSSTESPPKYLWKRNSSFYLVSNGRSEKYTFFLLIVRI